MCDVEHDESAHNKASVLRGWIIVVISLTGFVLMALAVNWQLTSEVDSILLTLFRDSSGDVQGPKWLQESLIDYTALGGYPIIVLVILTSVIGLYRSGKARAARFLAVSVTGGAILSSLMKLLFERPRPVLVEHLDQIYTSSFPSAHAMLSMLAWLTLALVISRFIRTAGLRRFLLTIAILMSLLIGFSRVYLGVHWPSDVLAGWFLGLAWAYASWLAAYFLTHDKQDLGQYGTHT